MNIVELLNIAVDPEHNPSYLSQRTKQYIDNNSMMLSHPDIDQAVSAEIHMLNEQALPNYIIKSIIKIVDMYLEVEEHHYDENSRVESYTKDHIFHDLVNVSHWIKEHHTMIDKSQEE